MTIEPGMLCNRLLVGVKTSNLKPNGYCDHLVLTFEDGSELEINSPWVGEYEEPFSIEVKL